MTRIKLTLINGGNATIDPGEVASVESIRGGSLSVILKSGHRLALDPATHPDIEKVWSKVDSARKFG